MWILQPKGAGLHRSRWCMVRNTSARELLLLLSSSHTFQRRRPTRAMFTCNERRRGAVFDNKSSGKSPRRILANNDARILKEMLSSETHYNEGLRQLLDEFVLPMSDLLDKDPVVEIQIVFDFIPHLLQLSNVILRDLHSSQNVVSVLIQHAPLIKDLYSKFIVNFRFADTALTSVLHPESKRRRWIKFLDGGKSLLLRDLLIRTIQIIPKYEMLLKELRKNTEHEDLTSIISMVNDIAKNNDVSAGRNALGWMYKDGDHWLPFSEDHSLRLTLSHALGKKKITLDSFEGTTAKISLKSMRLSTTKHKKREILYLIRSPAPKTST